MAISVKTLYPNSLVTSIKQGIRDGSIKTWRLDTDEDFRHTPEQWSGQGYLKPHVREGELYLSFGVVTPIASQTVICGVYEGRFSEMVLSHFSKDFSSISLTA